MKAVLQSIIPNYADVSPTVWIIFYGILVVLMVLSVVAWWRIFEKAGVAGWKSLIPVYSQYLQYKICWNKQGFIKLVIFSFISGIGEFFGSGEYGEIVTLIAGVVAIVAGILVLINMVKFSLKLAKSFGKSKGFGVGHFFVPLIFDYILGFGDAKYVGPSD